MKETAVESCLDILQQLFYVVEQAEAEHGLRKTEEGIGLTN